MKQTEIITEWSTFHKDIRKELVAKGYKPLGHGVDQMAYLEPSTGMVLKIFGTTSDRGKVGTLTPSQKMAVFWINYCKRNASNPFLPRFSGWESFEFGGKNYLQIRMERLGKFPRSWDYELEYIATMSRRATGQRDYEKYLGSDNEMRIGGTTSASELAIMLGRKQFDKLWRTCAELAKIGKAKHYINDLHSGNFMIRNDGTPVIVDPWVVPR